jgi:hypothetical protein
MQRSWCEIERKGRNSFLLSAAVSHGSWCHSNRLQEEVAAPELLGRDRDALLASNRQVTRDAAGRGYPNGVRTPLRVHLFLVTPWGATRRAGDLWSSPFYLCTDRTASAKPGGSRKAAGHLPAQKARRFAISGALHWTSVHNAGAA